jgi:hypothetical protein
MVLKTRNNQTHSPQGAEYLPPDVLSEESLYKLFRKCWARRTSFDPAGWTLSNPAWGQCAVTALVVQDLLGGDLLRCDVAGSRHYWNSLPSSDQELDLARHQFSGRIKPRGVDRRERGYVLSFPDTRRRYKLLRHLVYLRLRAQRPEHQCRPPKEPLT